MNILKRTHLTVWTDNTWYMLYRCMVTGIEQYMICNFSITSIYGCIPSHPAIQLFFCTLFHDGKHNLNLTHWKYLHVYFSRWSAPSSACWIWPMMLSCILFIYHHFNHICMYVYTHLCERKNNIILVKQIWYLTDNLFNSLVARLWPKGPTCKKRIKAKIKKASHKI